jgi:hypothetical protein
MTGVMIFVIVVVVVVAIMKKLNSAISTKGGGAERFGRKPFKMVIRTTSAQTEDRTISWQYNSQRPLTSPVQLLP